MSGKTVLQSGVGWRDVGRSVGGRSNGIGDHLGQKCKGESSMRHIWDRGDNRPGVQWEGGQSVYWGLSSCGLFSSELKMMAVLLWNCCSFTGSKALPGQVWVEKGVWVYFMPNSVVSQWFPVSTMGWPPLPTGPGYSADADGGGRVGPGICRQRRAGRCASCPVHEPQPVHRHLGKGSAVSVVCGTGDRVRLQHQAAQEFPSTDISGKLCLRGKGSLEIG